MPRVYLEAADEIIHGISEYEKYELPKKVQMDVIDKIKEKKRPVTIKNNKKIDSTWFINERQKRTIEACKETQISIYKFKQEKNSPIIR